jgi:hypothetical protein
MARRNGRTRPIPQRASGRVKISDREVLWGANKRVPDQFL